MTNPQQLICHFAAVSPSQLYFVSKLWNYCNILRDDGLSYGDNPGGRK